MGELGSVFAGDLDAVEIGHVTFGVLYLQRQGGKRGEFAALKGIRAYSEVPPAEEMADPTADLTLVATADANSPLLPLPVNGVL